MQIGDDVLITKLDEQGAPMASYEGKLVRLDDEAAVVACVWTWGKTVDVGPFTLVPGDLLYEYYYRDAWFNVFKVCDGTGELKGWYCNLTQPPQIGDGVISWVDLKLDLVVSAKGAREIADKDEFEALRPSPALRQRASQTLATLRAWHRRGQGPFSPDAEGACGVREAR